MPRRTHLPVLRPKTAEPHFTAQKFHAHGPARLDTPVRRVVNYAASSDPKAENVARRGIRGFVPHQFQLARLRTGLDLSGLAQLADLTNQALSTWETGQSTPSPNKLKAVVDVLQQYNPTPDQPITIASLTNIKPENAILEDLRGWAGLTQGDVARQASLGETTYRELESGRKPLPAALAEQFAQLYGVDADAVRAAAKRTAEHRLDELRARRQALRAR